jgi:hypothetical protein
MTDMGASRPSRLAMNIEANHDTLDTCDWELPAETRLVDQLVRAPIHPIRSTGSVQALGSFRILLRGRMIDRRASTGR